MTPEQTLDWLADQHFDQCREERPIQDWIRKMKSQLPKQEHDEFAEWMKPDALCDRSCMYVCTEGFTKFPECATKNEWVGLTNEDDIDWDGTGNLKQLVEAVEAKLKEKNNG